MQPHPAEYHKTGHQKPMNPNNHLAPHSQDLNTNLIRRQGAQSYTCMIIIQSTKINILFLVNKLGNLIYY